MHRRLTFPTYYTVTANGFITKGSLDRSNWTAEKVIINSFPRPKIGTFTFGSPFYPPGALEYEVMNDGFEYTPALSTSLPLRLRNITSSM
jgi:hypothetical protein